jgi:exonuclease SbcD
MLRILHTADWHLGQTFRGHSREFEHEAVLGSLLTIVQQHQIDTLLIAGNIFDSQHPSGESPSVITVNPAIRDRVKSGHREWPKT